MVLKQNEPIIILVPDTYTIHTVNSFTTCGKIMLNKNEYYAYKCVVHSNAELNNVTTGIEVSELMHGMCNGKYYVSDSGSACYSFGLMGRSFESWCNQYTSLGMA